MKVACISDLHGNLIDNVPECDLLLIAGDICPTNGHHPTRQLHWIGNHFNPWLQQQRADAIIMVPGNHDFVFEKYKPEMECACLISTKATYKGLTIWGHPYTPLFYDWAFVAPSSVLQTVNEAMPPCDILITHGPPHGILDVIGGVNVMVHGKVEPEHLGCRALRTAVERVKPKLHVFGHIHSGHGRMLAQGTQFINASLLGERYTVDYPVEVFEL